jgi:hypothetical protein
MNRLVLEMAEKLLIAEQLVLTFEGYRLQLEGEPTDEVDDQVLANARRLMLLRRLMAN